MKVDAELLSRWGIQSPPRPDFSRLRRALLRQDQAGGLPLFEVNIDDEVVAALLAEPVQHPGYANRRVQTAIRPEDGQRYVQQLTRLYYHLGYDYVILPVFLPMTSPTLIGKDTAQLPRAKGRAWVDEARGPVTTWAEFDHFGWCRLADVDCQMLEYAARLLPEGMGLIIRTRGVMEWLMRLMGFETLCYTLADDPDLVMAVAERIGQLVVGLVRQLVEIDWLGAVVLYDDMGFKTNTLIAPVDLRRYVLPWTKQAVGVTHAHGLPFILHACGNLERIMDDLIDDVGIDAKHSFEDVIMPMAGVKARYGGRIAILGGVDMHVLGAGTVEEVRAAAQQAIQDCAPGGGYAFGSGNTIANYVPLLNYFTMLDEAKRWIN